MAWDFETDADFERDLDWMDAFVRDELEPLDFVVRNIHGSLGVSNEMPFSEMVIESFHMGLADGPTEVHKVAVARGVLEPYKATLRARALERYAEVIERHVGNL